ncbi:MAG: hypothetical protein ACRCX2_10275 [Paraclostridium sp.]
MRKYYDLYEDRIVAQLDWKDGYGTLDHAKAQFTTDKFREIDKKEFDRLGKEYSNGEKK